MHSYVTLLQRKIQFSELTEVEKIAEGGFGVIHRAKHPDLGTVVYKELKSSFINDDSRFVIQICTALLSKILCGSCKVIKQK